MTEPVAQPPATGATQWIEAFARELGVEAPSRDVVERLLAMATVAAHASQRTAAPIACYLVGRAGASLERAAAAADAASRALSPPWPPTTDRSGDDVLG
ncbi:MAG TPA: DUF6457 domain-containing protein [Acidimicrobiales bacterium]|jgi:hypothetical protein|nr:DUF6457 domain-containing protein [Acidimicrobiales bacterium]